MVQIVRRARSPAKELMATNVSVLRAKRGLSQSALAERTGLSRATISNIERGEGSASIDVADRIADGLGVELHELFVRSLGADVANEDELIALAEGVHEGNVGARALLHSIDEAAGHPIERYSRAGRPRLVR
jgi:transcriptional regulator with XRE-family HTH domain